MNRKIPKKIQQSVRYNALETLERIDKGGSYSNILVNEILNKVEFTPQDSRLFTEIVYGTISRKLLLEYYLTPFYHQTKKIDSWVKKLLILSVYQMFYLDKIPDYAIINEAVEIAKWRGNHGISKFVNGILRGIQRKGLPAVSEIKDPMERLAIEVSMPLWLTKKIVDQIGHKETRELGLSLFERSSASARLDLGQINRQEAIEQLQAEGIEARISDVSPYGVIADKGAIASSSLFKEGKLTIQDESSMLVAPALAIETGNQVLDACGAPGGKTTHIATFLKATSGGLVTALDIHQHKVKLIQENAQRLKVEQVVATKLLDAREVETAFARETFDRILVDAPCSGLGLMRRKPDIKYHKALNDFQQLPEIQLAILESVAPTLKQSGIMIYSTCTINHEENQQVMQRFLEKHPEFKKMDIAVNEKVKPMIQDQMLTLYPHQLKTDGFFICCIQKISEKR